MKLTMIVSKGASGFYIGRIKEIPEVLTQGHTVEEVQDNLLDALELYLQDMRDENPAADGPIVCEKDLVLV